MTFKALHQALALVAAAAAMTLLVAGAVAQARPEAGVIRATVVARRAVLVAVLLAAVGGLAMLATRDHPRSGLHIVYGALAVLTVPIATRLSKQAPARVGLYHAAAGLVLLGIGYRLLTTG
jgi:hypothetical protein